MPVWALAGLGLSGNSLHGQPSATALEAGKVHCTQDGSRVEVLTQAAAEPEWALCLAEANALPSPLLGKIEQLADKLIFYPALPLVAGQKYRATWLSATGQRQRVEFQIHPLKHAAPTVQMRPQTALPANALKFYLHFSERMEQGIFLDRLRLLDATGKEVKGPFRETELWSPDGKRLTVWFHPGRQKTGVNLNIDEGPVLCEGTRYSLVVSASWCSAAGLPLGEDVSFAFDTVQADHQCPSLERWRITAPKVGTREPVRIDFDEALDTAMLTSALHVLSQGKKLALEVSLSPSGKHWSAAPEQPWKAGNYPLHADPLLEDLAGNSLTEPFEVDTEAARKTRAVLVREFRVVK